MSITELALGFMVGQRHRPRSAWSRSSMGLILQAGRPGSRCRPARSASTSPSTNSRPSSSFPRSSPAWLARSLSSTWAPPRSGRLVDITVGVQVIIAAVDRRPPNHSSAPCDRGGVPDRHAGEILRPLGDLWRRFDRLGDRARRRAPVRARRLRRHPARKGPHVSAHGGGDGGRPVARRGLAGRAADARGEGTDQAVRRPRRRQQHLSFDDRGRARSSA